MNETKPMKILNWVAGLGLAFSPLLAQEARAPIESDWAEMDLKAGVYHYSGNVRVDVPGLLKLTCGDLLAQPQKDTNRLDSLIATTNVVIEIQRQGRNPGDAPIVMRAYGDRAVYTATNEVVTLTGADTRIVDPSGTIRLEVEGICPGTILKAPRGSGGFGYDPVFLVDEAGQTFAEMAKAEKARLGHRGRAFALLDPQLRALLG
jgi:hypothetical protein